MKNKNLPARQGETSVIPPQRSSLSIEELNKVIGGGVGSGGSGTGPTARLTESSL